MTTFTWAPSVSTAVEHEPVVVKNTFGDGYAQRFSEGINNAPRVWRLTFTQVANAVADAVEAFIKARNGAEVFDWTPPGESAGRFVCEEGCRRVYSGFATSTLTMTFTEDFAP